MHGCPSEHDHRFYTSCPVHACIAGLCHVRLEVLTFLSCAQARIGLVCYFLLGAALLAPWNAFLTAIDYFSAVYVSALHEP